MQTATGLEQAVAIIHRARIIVHRSSTSLRITGLPRSKLLPSRFIYILNVSVRTVQIRHETALFKYTVRRPRRLHSILYREFQIFKQQGKFEICFMRAELFIGQSLWNKTWKFAMQLPSETEMGARKCKIYVRFLFGLIKYCTKVRSLRESLCWWVIVIAGKKDFRIPKNSLKGINTNCRSNSSTFNKKKNFTNFK